MIVLNGLLNIILFLLLKRIYSNKVNLFIRVLINYIIKLEFFIIFKIAYNKVFIKGNIKAGFKRARISL
ncbi:hypothetical protein diail_11811 [Diaporthe ilicicola]|nr:hypothetical protein diail_11811 [Diaporthe ilicicola]